MNNTVLDSTTLIVEHPDKDERQSQLPFSTFINTKYWTAWRSEDRMNKTDGSRSVTKVPYFAQGRKSRSDDPTTWLTIDAALEVAEEEGFICKPDLNGSAGGIGIYLGTECPEFDDWLLGGIDLDSCLDSNGNILFDWAADIIRLITSYTEVSPSHTGLKIYFRYRQSDQAQFREIMATQWSRNFKEQGGNHSPGFELHIGHRYFAVTGEVFNDGTTDINPVEVSTIDSLINRVGSHFSEPAGTNASADKPNTNNGQHDNSRSGRAFSTLRNLWFEYEINTYEEGKNALLDSPDSGIRDWMNEKGLLKVGNTPEREYARIWDKVKDGPRSWIASQYNDFAAQLAGEGEPEWDAQKEENFADNADEPPSEEPPKTEDSPFDFWSNLTPAPRLTDEMLPQTIRAFAFDQSERMGCDPAAVAMSCLVVCAAAINDDVVIQPREWHTWTESARLWIWLVGKPGSMKTPAQKVAVAPLLSMEEQWRDENTVNFARYKDQLADYQAKAKSYYATKEDERDDPPEKPEKPPRRRLYVGDITPEDIATIAADNPRGLLYHRDELTAFIGSMDAYANSGVKKDRPFYLKAFDGGYYPYDRKGTHDDPIMIRNLSLCSLGGIQTDKLMDIADTLVDDGLFQRALSVSIRNADLGVDCNPDLLAIGDYADLIKSLVEFDPLGTVIVKLSPAAHVLRRRFEELAKAFERHPALSPSLQTHAAKWGGMFARLLLTIHMINCAPALRPDDVLTVDEQSAQQAYNLMVHFFVPHAVQIYDQLFGSGGGEARWLAEHILNKKMKSVSLRDCQQSRRKNLSGARQARAAIEILIGMGWVRPNYERTACLTGSHTASRAATSWRVCPQVHTLFAERAKQVKIEHKARQTTLVKARRQIAKTYAPQVSDEC